MKIGVVWARGTLRFDISVRETIISLLKMIGEKIQVDFKHLELYSDTGFTQKIDTKKNVQNARIRSGMLLYLKVNAPLPDVPCAQMTTPIESAKDFLAEGEQMTPEMRRIQAEFGPRAVSTAFFEHRDQLKPRIDFQDESSCYAFRIGKEAIKRFQAIAFQEQFATHRIGFLFGRVNEVTGKVTVHCMCEPEQKNFPDHVEVSPEFDISVPVEIARCFGMQCVGMMISHQADEKFPMAPYMVQLAACYQNMFSEYFTTAVVTPRGDDVVVEAFQVSDAAMKMDKEQYFVPSKKPNTIAFKEELVVCGVKRSEADVNLFLCAVRVRQTHSKVPCHTFPAPSEHPTMLDLKRHLEDNEYCPWWRKLFDFNLLVFLAVNDILNLESDIPKVVTAIIHKEEIPEGYMELIECAAKRE